ncbi:catalase [Holotrichia oblita]|uniref:Catalase n=1 Tax=Holotrichia oblita TaxID=644536 RepID=A0ACB9TBZ8_HOLOL|nr:catalase [Holotrichia oblita]
MIPVNRQLINAYHRLIISNPRSYEIHRLTKRSKSEKDQPKRCTFRAQTETNVLTTASGAPISDKNASLSIGSRGPLLLQDVQLIEDLAHLGRERIPERVVHAKGGGAFGYFEVTDDITRYCAARLFESVGKRTNIAVRFSTTGGEAGSADSVRDPRGFAVKFYTEDGNFDLVANNTPIFFIRDPIFFPSLVHCAKRNPITHLPDSNAFWDFMSLRPESTHQIFILFGERGISDGFRFMNGYGGHTFKLVNDKGESVYCKFHLHTEQGIKWLEPDEATCIAGKAPDYAIEDLYEAIQDGNYPKWTMYIQVMTFEQAEKYPENPFDLTKVWPQKIFPLIKVGYFILNKNPKNYFTDVEQLAFSPAHLIPGILPSPDRMLIGRMFSYGDTQRYRLGKNYLQLPVNCPLQVKNYHRDGVMVHNNQGTGPNYYPNSVDGPEISKSIKKLHPPFNVAGDVNRFDSGSEDNFSQARILYQRVFNEEQKEKFIVNIAGSLHTVTSPLIQRRALDNIAKVDSSLEKRISDYLIKKKK